MRMKLARFGWHSPCCSVPIDESAVITDGKYKGHGPRYCSKCRAVLFLV